jgi:nitric oxide reductase large subunit
VHVYCIIKSRYSFIPTKDVNGNVVNTTNLIPIVDMINHKNPPNATQILTKDGYKVIASHDIKRHEPIYLSYGPQVNNYTALLNFGFVSQEPMAHVFKFKLKLINQFPLYAKKKELLDAKYHE